MAKKKSKNFNPVFFVFIIIGALCGFFGARLMDTLEDGGTPPIIDILYLMGVFLVSFFVVPLIHETGHLVMGLLTGYDFVSFRIGSLTIIKAMAEYDIAKKMENTYPAKGEYLAEMELIEYVKRLAKS